VKLKNHHTILIVEDDKGLNHLIQNILQKEGFQTQVVFNGAEAVTTALNNEIALIVLDYSLPDMSGYNVINALQEKNVNIPFIVLTGQGNEVIAVEMMKLGAKDYVIKNTKLLDILPVLINKVFKEIGLEKELTVERDKLLSIMNAMPSGVTIRNRDYDLVYQNDYITKIFGERLGEKCYKAFPGIDKICDGCPVEKAYEDGKNHTATRRIETPSKEITYWENVAIPIRNISGEIDSCIEINTNITDRKNMEKTMFEIEEQEQRRIGQDLHDDMGQLLTGTAFKVQALKNSINNKLPIHPKDIDDIISLINKAKDRTRKLTRSLLSLGTNSDSLIEALINLSDITKKTYGVLCDFKYDNTITIQSEMTISQLYRITQEAIINAIKHAKPKHIEICLFNHDGNVELKIKDDGRGNSDILNQPEGMGLKIMQYRSDLIGASFNIESDINKGTIVTCSFGKEKL